MKKLKFTLMVVMAMVMAAVAWATPPPGFHPDCEQCVTDFGMLAAVEIEVSPGIDALTWSSLLWGKTNTMTLTMHDDVGEMEGENLTRNLDVMSVVVGEQNLLITCMEDYGCDYKTFTLVTNKVGTIWRSGVGMMSGTIFA